MTGLELATLAKQRGLGERYLDYRGQPREVSLQTRAAILAAMGIDVDDAEAIAAALAEAPAAQTAAAKSAVRCHVPDFMAAGARPWGLSVQLYTLRSESDWGLGDFADLARLARAAAAQGADFIGLNPLHALFTSDPGQCSPYSPSTRHCLNVLYIAVGAVPDLADCPEAREAITAADFQQELARLRALDLVDYAGVARCKLPILRQLYGRFRQAELQAATPRATAFRAYLVARADTVGRHALFEALDAEMRSAHDAPGGWPTWPERYQDPDSAAVAAFAQEAVEEVEFHAWLQWIAESQLAGAQRAAREAGMRIGLYGDHAVGAHPGGSETWSRREAYCEGASIGAPPDALAPRGQDWGLAPPDPWVMSRDGCRGFAQLMRNNMRHFGALRLDHVMALYRLWWVPRGLPASEGGYVHYPVAQMFEAVATESRRHECLVVGENLGTVPPEVDRAMTGSGMYGYTVLYFERDAAGEFKAPADWSPGALASVTTHDLPSLRAWWEGSDIELRAQLGMYPQGEDLGKLAEERETDRMRLVRAMARAGVWPDWPVDRFEPQFAGAVHAFLASTACALVAVQAEDLLGMVDPVNIPGTSSEYGNWQRKLCADVDALLTAPSARPLLEALGKFRPR